MPSMGVFGRTLMDSWKSRLYAPGFQHTVGYKFLHVVYIQHSFGTHNTQQEPVISTAATIIRVPAYIQCRTSPKRSNQTVQNDPQAIHNVSPMNRSHIKPCAPIFSHPYPSHYFNVHVIISQRGRHFRRLHLGRKWSH